MNNNSDKQVELVDDGPTWWDVVIKAGITIGVLLFLGASQINELELSAEAVALIVIAILPWLSSILDSIELPGGGGFTFRRRVQKEFDKTNSQLAIQMAATRQQQEKLDAQQRIINELVIYSMSHLIFKHLAGLKKANEEQGEYLFQGDLDSFRRDLRYLRDHGYLHHFHVRELQPGQNLVGVARLTPAGEFFVDMRHESNRQKHLEKERIAANMQSDK